MAKIIKVERKGNMKKSINGFIVWFFKRFHISFNEFATVLAVTALAGAGIYGIYFAGKQVTILPTSEFNEVIGNPSLEAAADLKALGR